MSNLQSIVNNRTAVALSAFVAAITALAIYKSYKSKSKRSNGSRPSRRGSDEFYTPPLPPAVCQVLEASKLCFLATNDSYEPHLSLMNFTYYQPEEIIILTTRRNTKKFGQILNNPKVAVLIHDFPHLESEAGSDGGSAGQTLSVTLNGTVVVSWLFDMFCCLCDRELC
jgi:Pyridoxamine 5'-phosphate oxidase